MAIGAALGSIGTSLASGGVEFAGAIGQANSERRALENQIRFETLLTNAIDVDPLLRRILAGLRGDAQGNIIDPNKLFEQGVVDINQVSQRQGRQTQEQLAQFGALGGDQAMLATSQIDRANALQQQALKDLIDTQASIVNPQQRQLAAQQFSQGVLGQQALIAGTRV